MPFNNKKEGRLSALLMEIHEKIVTRLILLEKGMDLLILLAIG